MAQSVGALRAEMEAGEARFGRDMGKARRHAKQFNSSAQRGFKKTNRAAAQMSAAIRRSAAAILFIAGPAVIGLFVKASIAAAGDAAEAWSKFDAVFKDQAEATRAWALDFADNVGRSRSEVASWLATLQDTFVPMGIARDKAGDLSKQLVTLAVDLGSFNNIADTEVIEALQSALVGNHETMRRFGIVINETNIKQEAWRAGITETGEKLAEQDKILARLNLIMAGTGDAQGDVARTSESLNNQTKMLAANWKNFREELGNKFAPTAAETVGWLSRLTKGATDVVTGVAGAELRFKTVSEEFDRLSEKIASTDNAFVKADLEKRLNVAGKRMIVLAQEIAVLRGEVVLTDEDMANAAVSANVWAEELENLEEPTDLIVSGTKEMNKELDRSDKEMKEVAASAAVLKIRLARMDDQLAKNIVTVQFAQTEGQLLAEMLSAAFADPKDRGEAFKGFILKMISLIEAAIIASGGLSASLTAAFTPLGVAASIAALATLEIAKASVRSLKFAGGGQFTVGGPSGIDATPVSFLASRGEDVLIRTPAQVAAGAGMGGGGATLILRQENHFDGITPEQDVRDRILPQIEGAARDGFTDLISLKNIKGGSSLGGDLMRLGKGQ